MTKIDARKTAVRISALIANCPDSHTEIAAKMLPPVDKSLVTKWRSGSRKPTDAQLARLEELYGAAAPPPPPPAEEELEVEEPAPAGVVEDDGHGDDNHARLRGYIRSGIRELQSDRQLSGVKRAEALKKLVDAQVALDRSTGENAITMHRIAAHPEFQRVVRLIVDAIAPFPEALRAATDALRVGR